MKPSFVFILNPILFDGSLPIEIIPKHFLQRADAVQIEIIKETLFKIHPYSGFGVVPYERNAVMTQEGPTHKQWSWEPIPPEDWRYFIITFEGYNSEIHDLSIAASLLKNELEFGFTIMGGFGGWPTDNRGYGNHMGNAESLLSFFIDNIWSHAELSRLGPTDIARIAENHKLIRMTTQHDSITRALHLFATLKTLPRQSEMLVLGLFSIIECLITHSPDPKDPTDSITRQVKTKIPLLRKRFDRALQYEAFFDEAKEETIWRDLYRHRSLIAHGERADIKSQTPILRDNDTVRAFLRETVKLLLSLALREPVLITDLKQC